MQIYAGTLQKTAVVQISDLILWILRWMDSIDLMGELHGLQTCQLRQVQWFRLRFTSRPGGNSAFLKFLILKSLCKERPGGSSRNFCSCFQRLVSTVSMKHVPIAISYITDQVNLQSIIYHLAKNQIWSTRLGGCLQGHAHCTVSHKTQTLLADFGSFPGNLPQQWHKSDQPMTFCWAKN